MATLSKEDVRKIVALTLTKSSLPVKHLVTVSITDCPDTDPKYRNYKVKIHSYSGVIWCFDRSGLPDDGQARVLLESLEKLPVKIGVLFLELGSSYCLRVLGRGTGEGPLLEISGWAKKWEEEDWKKAGGRRVPLHTKKMIMKISGLMKQGTVIILRKENKKFSENKSGNVFDSD